MKKVILLVVTGAVLISLVATPVLATGKYGQAGKSNVGHLYLYEKDPTWTIVEDGAWGKLKYNLAGPEFEYGFNGHGLESNTDYSLIYYPEVRPPGTWPWWVIIIDAGMTNNGGNIHLAGSVELNMDLPDPNNTQDGAKIWLVLTDDINVATGELQWWNPTEYLFENNLITYEHIDD